MNATIRDVVGGVIIRVLVILLVSSTLSCLVFNWLNNSYYSHGFLVPLVSGFFLWRRCDVFARDRRNPGNLGLLVLGISLVAFLVAQVWQAYHISAVALIVLLSGLALYFLGVHATPRLPLPPAFLLFFSHL